MADKNLRQFTETVLQQIVKESKEKGDSNVSMFLFSRQYSAGCDFHPSLAEHTLIAAELTAYLSGITGW